MVFFKEQKSLAVITETSEERLMVDSELKNHCLQFLDSLRGKVFVNRARRIQIEVGKEIKNEMWSKIHINPKKRRPLARIKLMALKAIPYFLTDSDPDSLGEPDKNNRANIKESHVFKYKCRINGDFFLVRIRTRQKLTGSHRLYFLSFEDLTLKEI